MYKQLLTWPSYQQIKNWIFLKRIELQNNIIKQSHIYFMYILWYEWRTNKDCTYNFKIWNKQSYLSLHNKPNCECDIWIIIYHSFIIHIHGLLKRGSGRRGRFLGSILQQKDTIINPTFTAQLRLACCNNQHQMVTINWRLGFNYMCREQVHCWYDKHTSERLTFFCV